MHLGDVGLITATPFIPWSPSGVVPECMADAAHKQTNKNNAKDNFGSFIETFVIVVQIVSI